MGVVQQPQNFVTIGVEPGRQPGAGLVEVGHRRGHQLRTDDLDEPAQPGRGGPARLPTAADAGPVWDT